MDNFNEIINSLIDKKTENGKLTLTKEMVMQIINESVLDAFKTINMNNYLLKTEKIEKVIVHENMINVRCKNKRIHIFRRENEGVHIEIINLNKSKIHYPSIAFKSLRKNATVNAISLSKQTMEALIAGYVEMRKREWEIRERESKIQI